MIVNYIVDRNAKYSSRDPDGPDWEIRNEKHALIIHICCIPPLSVSQRLHPAHRILFFQQWQYVSDIKVC
jgi:hypothetical protein